MPLKTCSICGDKVGPRAQRCKNGHTFDIKHKTSTPEPHPKTLAPLQTSISPSYKKKRKKRDTTKASLKSIHLKDHVTICNDENEKRIREKYYGVESKTYETLCGQYRIRHLKRFTGVSLDKSLQYCIMIKTNYGWELLPDKNRFKTLRKALLHIIELKLHADVSTI